MRISLALCLAALALSATLPHEALAQNGGHTLLPGDTVRVLAPAYHAQRVQGELVLYQSDTLAVRETGSGTRYAFPVSAVRELYKNEGRDVRRSVRHWARAGLFLGAAAGLVAGPLIATSDAEGGILGPTLVAGLGGGVLGLGLGAAGGTLFARDHWQRFRTPIVPPASTGVALGITLPAP